MSLLTWSSILLISACGAQVDLAAIASLSDTTILRTTPPDGAAAVATNTTSVAAAVDETISAEDCSATLVCGSTSIELGSPTFNSVDLICSWPINQTLPASTSCTTTFEIAGTSSTLTFTTAAGPDTTVPTVSTSNPSNNATGVATNLSSVRMTFSEEMDTTTCTTGNLTSSPALTFSSCSASSDTKSFTWSISGSLTASTTYTVTPSTNLKDTAGNALTASTLTFTTATGSDTTAPGLSTSTPTNGATGVATNLTGITLDFNEAMNTSQCVVSNLSVSPALTLTGCTANAAGTSFTWAISGTLTANTTYTATTSANLTDAAGNSLSAVTRTFTTAAAGDTTAPTVSSTDPANGATNFLICGPIYVCFSETISADQCATANATYTGNASPPAPAGFSYCCVTGTSGCSTKSGACSGTEFEWGLDWPTICGNTARSGGGQVWNISTGYTITISNVADPSGNTMTATSFSMTTGNN